MSRRSALAGLLRDAARVDRTQSDPVVAARNAIGVAAPLAVGALAGSAAFGLPSTIGAIQTAFADRPGPYRLRVIRMVTTAAVAGTTSALAVALSGSDIASALLLTVIGILAGLLLAIGPSGTQVGVAATAAALVIGHQAERPGVAIHVGLLVLAGGAAQLLLALAGWPLGRHRPERIALTELYQALAQLARKPPGTETGPPLGEVLASVRQTLFGLGHDHGPSVEAYRVLLDEGERIRRELIVLSGYAQRLPEPAAGRLGAVLLCCADVLDEIASSLAAARPLDDGVIAPMRSAVAAGQHALDETLERAGRDGIVAASSRAASIRLRTLSGQLRAAVATTATGASEGRQIAESEPSPLMRLREPLAVLRANINPGSPVMRHALRLGLLVGGSDLVVRMAGVSRGYWVPLTIVVVLRPDFGTTFQRSILRVAGTIVGLFAATALVHWIPGGQWYSIALVALFFFGMRLAGPGNIGIGAACLAALVVILLSLAGVSPHTSVLARGVDTLAGGALAVFAVLIGPVWERGLVRQRLTELLAAYRGYTAAVADLALSPAGLQQARSAARLARTNAQASIDRARAEPVPARHEVELGEAVLAHSHRFVHAMLTLEGLRPALREVGGLPEIRTLLEDSAAVLRCCELALASDADCAPDRDLRADHERLVERLTREPAAAGSDEVAAALIEAGDRVANSVDTLVSAVRRATEPTWGR